MSKSGDDLPLVVYEAAEKAVRLYAQGIFSIEVLSALIMQEWEIQRQGDDQPSSGVCIRISQRICSRGLCQAWLSFHSDMRDIAFDNLKNYLTQSLKRTKYGRLLRQYATAFDDVVYQTLEELHLIRTKKTNVGPDDPERFLKWVQVIMIHQAQNMLEKLYREGPLSLDEQLELSPEIFVDKSNPNPLEHVLQDEQQQKLLAIIMSMRNPDYKRVLIETYLLGLEDRELAERMGVSMQKIYTWRCRALKVLRDNPEILELLHYWRE